MVPELATITGDPILNTWIYSNIKSNMYNLRILKLQGIEGSEPRKVLKRRSPSEVVEYVKEKLCDSLMLPGEPVVTLELGDEPVTLEADITDHRYVRKTKFSIYKYSLNPICKKYKHFSI